MLTLEELATQLEKHRESAAARVKEFAIGGTPFAFNRRSAIMGVVNLSADSWYRGVPSFRTRVRTNRPTGAPCGYRNLPVLSAMILPSSNCFLKLGHPATFETVRTTSEGYFMTPNES